MDYIETMYYYSTRDIANIAPFRNMLLSGTADDGGLYVPFGLPEFSPYEIRNMNTFHDILSMIMQSYSDDFADDITWRRMINKAYKNFPDDIIPIRKLTDNIAVAEMHHGPTQSFKDFAMVLLAEMMEYALEQMNEFSTIVMATSGDTGSAAMHAFKNSTRIKLFVLFPNGRVSSVQHHQMVCNTGVNCHAIAVNGSFDDCQTIVKSLFASIPGLSSVNSINWARIAIQSAYYFQIARNFDEYPSFVVPSGNFGNAYSGHVARMMGLNVDRIIAAVNSNAVLKTAIMGGIFEKNEVIPTYSSSMDIGNPSNFERLMRDVNINVEDNIRKLDECGRFEFPVGKTRKYFDAYSVNDQECLDTIKHVWNEHGYAIDPHTAVGVCVAMRNKLHGNQQIVLSTASPCKFPETMRKAGVEVDEIVVEGEENYIEMDNDYESIRDYILNKPITMPQGRDLDDSGGLIP